MTTTGKPHEESRDDGRGVECDDGIDIDFPGASASTLHRLLSQPAPQPPSLRGDTAAARRHDVAAAVHASWTYRGTEVAGLAER